MTAITQERLAQHDYAFTVIIERDVSGAYIAHCPALPGCHSAGDTEEEAREMIADAIALFIDSSHEHGETVPADVSVATVHITA